MKNNHIESSVFFIRSGKKYLFNKSSIYYETKPLQKGFENSSFSAPKGRSIQLLYSDFDSRIMSPADAIPLARRNNNVSSHARTSRGFTLIEVLVVIGILAVLAGVVLIAVNPGRQFKLARDSQRVANVNAILNAIGQNISENKGIFKCDGVTIPTQEKTIKAPAGTDGVDIRSCLVPTYISEIPFDPTNGFLNSDTQYNTYYLIHEDTNGRITISSEAEATSTISVTR